MADFRRVSGDGEHTADGGGVKGKVSAFLVFLELGFHFKVYFLIFSFLCSVVARPTAGGGCFPASSVDP